MQPHPSPHADVASAEAASPLADGLVPFAKGPIPFAKGPIPFAKGPIPFTKGHGTENDFVVLPDLDGELELTAGHVVALCDRRSGLGGDGVLRVVRTAALSPSELAADDAAAVVGSAAEFFMDYRNADGTFAEMCGNGIRVFVRYLLDHHLVAEADLQSGHGLLVATRAGDKRVRLVAGDHDDDPAGGGDGAGIAPLIAVDLGPWRVVGSSAAVAAGSDASVEVAGLDVGTLPGLRVDVGNPHVVCALPERALLAAADLTRGPRVSPEPSGGVNVELVVPVHEPGERGHLLMRVHERGSGETRSCGTGAVAAALAARAWAGPGGPDLWLVDVPGGRLRVEVPAGGLAEGRNVELVGPAVLVATGLVDLDRLISTD